MSLKKWLRVIGWFRFYKMGKAYKQVPKFIFISFVLCRRHVNAHEKFTHFLLVLLQVQ